MLEKEQLKEQRKHGTPFFPYASYVWSGTSKSSSFIHWHEETEIVYLESGTFTFHCDMKEYQQEAPAFLLINSEQLHRIDLREGQKESAFVFHLGMLSFQSYDETEAELIEALIKGKMEFPMVLTREEKSFEIIKELYDKCLEEAQKTTLSSQLKIKGYLLQLLAELYENQLFVIKDNEENQEEALLLIKKVLNYIIEHYKRKIKIQELADLVNMNPQYFCRFFKKKTGKTFTTYLNEYRLERIKKELLGTEKKMIDIASENGFENIGYFMKQFKLYTGVTPLTYRKQNKSK